MTRHARRRWSVVIAMCFAAMVVATAAPSYAWAAISDEDDCTMSLLRNARCTGG